MGPFSAVGSCSLDGDYRLILVKEDLDTPDYNEKITSNLGDVFIKDHTAVQFDDEMEVRLIRDTLQCHLSVLNAF